MITSHDMSELEELAGRVVMIDRGKMTPDIIDGGGVTLEPLP